MKMKATDNRDIDILGALILRISGKSPTNASYDTRQIVYISDNINMLFLSKQTCIALGVIPQTIPTVGDVHSSPPTAPDTRHRYRNPQPLTLVIGTATHSP
jgi:hypothetical protein